MFGFTVYSGSGEMTAEVRQFTNDPPKCLLTICIGDHNAEIDIFTNGSSLDKILDLGYAIVAAANRIKNVPYVEDKAFNEAINSAVGPPSDAGPAFVPFAIQDVEISAVEDPDSYDAPGAIQCGSHEEAVALAKKLNAEPF